MIFLADVELLKTIVLLHLGEELLLHILPLAQIQEYTLLIHLAKTTIAVLLIIHVMQLQMEHHLPLHL